ncbi:molecular chaperone TorD family protein [Plesiomonas sp.]|uniref:molecular chaperone TorD family protein n=1 Tax=Plesiomonas sp. TaxID=2486279 RepID=UPI003F38C900
MMIAVVSRILGGLLYYPPDSEQAAPLRAALPELPTLFSWPESALIEPWCAQLAVAEPDLRYHFSVLFEGQGEMPAPPWGSVYQDQDNLLLAESAQRYRAFLAEQNICFDSGLNEPEDQIGLMLLALAYLLEQGHDSAAITLLEEHVLPWSARYVQLLSAAEYGHFYPTLGKVLGCFLQTLIAELELTPRSIRLHR